MMYGETNKITASQRIEIMKQKNRPNIVDYISYIFDDFIEFKGDRCFGDDQAILGGIARLGDVPITVIGHHKGKNTQENIDFNFAMAHPEGYRKALRLMEQAEKFKRPIICLVDTPGAYCGIGAEERGQGEAIAKSLQVMMALKTPVISIVTGEGGSGGALGLAVANKVYMLENAVYSVISPRGFASILWKDASREKEAAELLKMTAQDLFDAHIIEGIIPEPKGGAHNDVKQMCKNMETVLRQEVSALSALSGEALAQQRYEKFRHMGVFWEK